MKPQFVLPFEKDVPSLIAVDDDDDIRDIISEVIKDAGYKVFPCSSGREALAIARNNVITGIISDISMAQGTGIEFLRRLQSMGINAPLAFVSGYASLENLVLAIRLGAVDFLVKPFQQDELTHMIHRIVAIGQRVLRIDEILKVAEALVEKDLIVQVRDLERQISMLKAVGGQIHLPAVSE